MRYVSTRGTAPELGFADVLLAGLAADGGLYVPERWPRLDPALLVPGAVPGGYAELAVEVMWPFVEGDIDRDAFAAIVTDAYATFDDPDVTPLRELGAGVWLLELFHGRTLAFKDVALSLVGRLFDHELARRGERVTVVGATSGDTGSAAIDALAGLSTVDVVILHPAGRTSDIQRRQMTTVDAANVSNVAVDGTFDDCQDLVKAMFADTGFRAAQRLSAVNSINWARVMAQIVYYVAAARALGGGPVSFCVPTGNFGNVFAGWVAMRMGVPVRRLVVASNTNDIVTRFLATGSMTIEQVVPTLSPSMDIQVSSNLERLLFELHGRDGAALAEAMIRFRAEGTIDVEPEVLAAVSETFVGARVDDAATTAAIAATWRDHHVLVDPHTAVGLDAVRQVGTDPGVPMVVLATAHPAKFPEAVEAATGERAALPERLADLADRPEHYVTLPVDLAAIEAHVAAFSAR